MFFSKSPNFKIDELVGGPVSPSSDAVSAPQVVAATDLTPIVGKPEVAVPEVKSVEINQGEQSNVNQSNRTYRTNQTYPRRNYQNFGDRFEGSAPVQGFGQQRPFVRRERSMEDANVPTSYKEGILDLLQEGNGVLRPQFRPSNDDIYISQTQIRKFNLREGDLVGGQVRDPKQNERYHGLLKVEKVNGIEVDKVGVRPDFDKLTAIYPKAKIMLETGKEPLATRVIDLIAPIGFGQRGLIVSPPKAGKTTILKQIAKGVEANFPNAHLMAVLIGERPEEVTDLTRNIKGDVIASNFDEAPQNQTRLAELAIERAKRLVENGIDVIILLDSVTRLARAYNMCVPSSGRSLSGGFDPAALFPTKKFFGAARCAEEGGSLTIIGTALIETGSRLDDLVYEEFKGTGNMELHLSRKLAERRVFPAIDVARSGTRAEELLFSEEDLKKVVTMHRMFDLLGADERTDMFLEKLGKTDSNREFMDELGKN
jgi:transcription termination factor Rho